MLQLHFSFVPARTVFVDPSKGCFVTKNSPHFQWAQNLSCCGILVYMKIVDLNSGTLRKFFKKLFILAGRHGGFHGGLFRYYLGCGGGSQSLVVLCAFIECGASLWPEPLTENFPDLLRALGLFKPSAP